MGAIAPMFDAVFKGRRLEFPSMSIAPMFDAEFKAKRLEFPSMLLERVSVLSLGDVGARAPVGP